MPAKPSLGVPDRNFPSNGSRFMRKLMWAMLATAHEKVQSIHLHPPVEAQPRLFPARGIPEGLGYFVCHRPLASEADLAYYERNTVNLVYKVMTALGTNQAANEMFPLDDEFDFYNNLSAFDSDSLEPAVDDYLKLRRSVADKF
ncbi:uncharacterized protein V1513DRAFT_434070 [Lipomyces chichibuensis]|uniref:uncharacterized protein n=1 Tax=Lipomyces chichibuensis TaxID=1546026 RepID=UPI0033442F45